MNIVSLTVLAGFVFCGTRLCGLEYASAEGENDMYTNDYLPKPVITVQYMPKGLEHAIILRCTVYLEFWEHPPRRMFWTREPDVYGDLVLHVDSEVSTEYNCNRSLVIEPLTPLNPIAEQTAMNPARYVQYSGCLVDRDDTNSRMSPSREFVLVLYKPTIFDMTRWTCSYSAGSTDSEGVVVQADDAVDLTYLQMEALHVLESDNVPKLTVFSKSSNYDTQMIIDCGFPGYNDSVLFDNKPDGRIPFAFMSLIYDSMADFIVRETHSLRFEVYNRADLSDSPVRKESCFEDTLDPPITKLEYMKNPASVCFPDSDMIYTSQSHDFRFTDNYMSCVNYIYVGTLGVYEEIAMKPVRYVIIVGSLMNRENAGVEISMPTGVERMLLDIPTSENVPQVEVIFFLNQLPLGVFVGKVYLYPSARGLAGVYNSLITKLLDYHSIRIKYVEESDVNHVGEVTMDCGPETTMMQYVVIPACVVYKKEEEPCLTFIYNQQSYQLVTINANKVVLYATDAPKPPPGQTLQCYMRIFYCYQPRHGGILLKPATFMLINNFARDYPTVRTHFENQSIEFPYCVPPGVSNLTRVLTGYATDILTLMTSDLVYDMEYIVGNRTVQYVSRVELLKSDTCPCFDVLNTCHRNDAFYERSREIERNSVGYASYSVEILNLFKTPLKDGSGVMWCDFMGKESVKLKTKYLVQDFLCGGRYGYAYDNGDRRFGRLLGDPQIAVYSGSSEHVNGITFTCSQIPKKCITNVEDGMYHSMELWLFEEGSSTNDGNKMFVTVTKSGQFQTSVVFSNGSVAPMSVQQSTLVHSKIRHDDDYEISLVVVVDYDLAILYKTTRCRYGVRRGEVSDAYFGPLHLSDELDIRHVLTNPPCVIGDYNATLTSHASVTGVTHIYHSFPCTHIPPAMHTYITPSHAHISILQCTHISLLPMHT